MKTKVIVAFSTNRPQYLIDCFTKEIKNSIGLSFKKDEYAIIPFVNNGEYSLTQTYNQILGETEADKDHSIIVFCHHDIHFKCKGWGKNLLNIFNNNKVDILGLAGTDFLNSHGVWWLNEQGQMTGETLWGKVWHTNGKKGWVSDFTSQAKKCAKVQPVVAIDGVFMVVNPATCIDFDEEFGGFHLYDISFCVENFLHGKRIAVTETIQIVHESGGQLSTAWEENRAKLSTIYQNYLPMRVEDYEEEEQTEESSGT